MWHRAKQNAMKSFTLESNWGPWGQIKSSNIIKFQLQSQFQRFLYQTLFVLLQINDRKHIERNVHSVAWIMPQGGAWGAGGQKLKRGDLRCRHIDCAFCFSKYCILCLKALFYRYKQCRPSG